MEESLSKSQWYLRRLAAMQPVEILHRLREFWLRKTGKALQGWDRYSLPGDSLPCLEIDPQILDRLTGAHESEWRSFAERLLSGAYEALLFLTPAGQMGRIQLFSP